MDSDDISYPNRLRRQLNYLLENNLDMVGSNVRLIDESGNSIGSRIAPKGRSINKKIPFGSTFIHPSCMYKKDLIIKARGYNSGFNSEDYDLWLRVATKEKIGLINKKLITKYAGHENQLSFKHWGMDRFRVISLEKLLKTASNTQKYKIKEELIKKYTLLYKGALKYDKIIDINFYQRQLLVYTR